MQLDKTFRTWLLLALALAGFTSPAKAAPPVAASYHFAGLSTLTDNPSLVTLHKVFALTNSPKFYEAVINSLSELLPTALDLGPTADPSLLHPILEDLSQAESVGSFGGAATGPIQFVLAIHLTKDRAGLWQTNLGKLLPSSFHVTPAGDWLIVSRGTELLSLQTSYLNNIHTENRPVPVLTTNWFEADVDWTRMAAWLPLTNCPMKLARTVIAITTRGDDFRTTGKIIYPEAIPWKSEPWKFPTASVSDPLISFTAFRDAAPYLNINKDLAQFVTDPFSTQLFIWAMEGLPLQSFGATPVTDATNLMQQVYSKMPAVFNPQMKQKHEGELIWTNKFNRVYWSNLGMLAPYVQPRHEKAGDYILAGLFPLPPRNKPVPAALWSEINGINDLVYYDWEGTGLRMQHWRLLSQILPILPPTSRSHATGPIDPSAKKTHALLPVVVRENWLEKLTPLLTETVTQITRTGPNELSFLRKSQLGLTGFELVLASHWLSGTGTGPFNSQLLPHKAKSSGPGQ